MEQSSGAHQALLSFFVDLCSKADHTCTAKKSLYANAQKVDSNHWDVNPPWI
jgi:hypothetical protein